MAARLLEMRITAGYGKGQPVLEDITLAVESGEILALVGQSGSGKSSLAMALLRLIGYRGGWVRGSIVFEGTDLMGLPERRMRELRGSRIGLVLQSPVSSLNPCLRLRDQLREAWLAHRSADGSPWRQETGRAMELACLPSEETFLRRYPSEISVGQAQRVLIAMAILHRPSLLIADEPTSALDVITQAEILKLFADLNRKLSTAVLFISHDLLSVSTLAHRVAILERGSLVECGPVRQVFDSPAHPFTRRLIGCLPQPPSREPEAVPANDLRALVNSVGQGEPVTPPVHAGESQ
ncbi:MAG: ABC transporter ATP-binding protein [Acidimicrobiia bacterium]|nr:ABC transporter ATP-binding protein [Acidimicrobiia bacterium]